MKYLFITLLLFPLLCSAQLKISGRVLDIATNQPVAKASVFLNNAMAGNSSGDDGRFVLYNVKPGQYELIVSILGYESYITKVLVNEDTNTGDIKIIPKSIALNEVTVTPDKDWFEKYELFKREFLGPSENAKKCRILNPEILTLTYSQGKRIFNASSDGYLEIENEALGYKIRYRLNKLMSDRRTTYLYYEGTSSFTPMAGKPSKQKTWEKNRLKTYLGSSMHFFRAIIGNRMEQENFKVHRLIRKRDSTRRSIFGNAQLLVKTPLTVTDFVRITDVNGIYALKFDDHLYIMYTKKRDRQALRPAYRAPDAPDYATSIIGIESDYGLFDANGVIINATDVVFEGMWAQERIAGLLPVDYEPPQK